MMNKFVLIFILLFLHCAANAFEATLVTTKSMIPLKNLNLVLYSGNILETPKGVEVVIKHGQISYYNVTQNWTIPIKDGKPVITAQVYNMSEIKNLLKPHRDGTLIQLTGSATIQIINPETTSSQTDIVQQMLERNKLIQVLIIQGKIKGVFKQKIEYVPYEGGLIKFEKGNQLQ